MHVALSCPSPRETYAVVEDAVAFIVVDPSEGDGARGEWTGDYDGVVRPMLDWEISEMPASGADTDADLNGDLFASLEHREALRAKA